LIQADERKVFYGTQNFITLFTETQSYYFKSQNLLTPFKSQDSSAKLVKQKEWKMGENVG